MIVAHTHKLKKTLKYHSFSILINDPPLWRIFYFKPIFFYFLLKLSNKFNLSTKKQEQA